MTLAGSILAASPAVVWDVRCPGEQPVVTARRMRGYTDCGIDIVLSVATGVPPPTFPTACGCDVSFDPHTGDGATDLVRITRKALRSRDKRDFWCCRAC